MTLYSVTGGAGFIGSHLTEALVQRGDRVRVLDSLATGQLDNLSKLEVGEPGSGAPVEFWPVDVREKERLGEAFEGVEGVLHQAAQVSVPRSIEAPEESLEVNATGTLRVLEAARKAGVRRVVLAASSAAYGNSETLPKREDMPNQPLSPYAIGKAVGEQMLKVWSDLYGLKTVSLRYFNIFGPRQRDDSPYTGVIAIFIRRLLDGAPVTIHGDGGQTRDFTYVANAVQANLLALGADDANGEVYNVGAGERVSLNQLFETLAGLIAPGTKASHGPVRDGDVRHSLADLTRITEGLGYAPEVRLEEGLRYTIDWYRGLSS
jgi:nucleoside-diphosphate-sugar epimerase